MTQLQEEVTFNTKTLQTYEQMLLDRLANAQGSLLDDVELIDVLATIKNKSKEVNEKLAEGKEKKIEINEKREAFRGVAARGSVLYFCFVEMIKVNWMYNISLQQFLCLFDWAIDNSPKAQLTKDRVHNITQELTRKVYRYINRGTRSMVDAAELESPEMGLLQMAIKVTTEPPKGLTRTMVDGFSPALIGENRVPGRPDPEILEIRSAEADLPSAQRQGLRPHVRHTPRRIGPPVRFFSRLGLHRDLSARRLRL
jgi:hypothetical protein